MCVGAVKGMNHALGRALAVPCMCCARLVLISCSCLEPGVLPVAAAPGAHHTHLQPGQGRSLEMLFAKALSPPPGVCVSFVHQFCRADLDALQLFTCWCTLVLSFPLACARAKTVPLPCPLGSLSCHSGQALEIEDCVAMCGPSHRRVCCSALLWVCMLRCCHTSQLYL